MTLVSPLFSRPSIFEPRFPRRVRTIGADTLRSECATNEDVVVVAVVVVVEETVLETVVVVVVALDNKEGTERLRTYRNGFLFIVFFRYLW